jgi:CHAD domain-containing protein
MKPATKSLAKFAEAHAAERLKTLAANLRKARAHPGHAGPIHYLRVSIRRFTQTLRVFRDLWDHRHYRKMRRRLRKLMDLCGAVRNCDIAIEILAAAGVPAAQDLQDCLEKRRSRAENDLSEQLEIWKSEATMRPWRGWLRIPTGKAAGIESRARQILRPLRQTYFEVGSRAAQPETKPDELHELRLAAKGLRYSLEIFGDLAGAGWEQEIERIREVQDLLGAVNDCVTTSGLVAECGNNAEVRRSKAALKRLLDQRAEAFRDHWRKVYDSKKRRRSD